MQRRNWNFLEPPPELAHSLSARLELTLTMARILVNRGIGTAEEAERFLHPSLHHLHDPFLMKGMERAVEVLSGALERRERILVFGDYDVDGVTGTALLVSYLRHFTDRVDYYVPHRVEEGYGLQAERIRRFAAEGGGLVLTVDCGISGAAEVEEGRSLGLSFIITDHHEPPPSLPDAEAVLNPLQEGCPYPFKSLAGVGIAYKLVEGLDRRQRSRPGPFPEAFPSPTDFLDLVALGTVADIVPLRDENRVFVTRGLQNLNRRPRTGLKALREVSGLGQKPLKTSHIAFALGPRINAAGRLGRADMAVDLMLATDASRAWDLADGLNTRNRERQQVEARIMEEATEMIRRDPSFLEEQVLVLSSPEWHSGVIGVVASKLAERYSRPSVLISTGSDPGKGSARSVPRFDLYSSLQDCSHLLEKFGGHSYAAGLSIRHDLIPRLRRELNARHRPLDPSEDRRPLDIDARVGFVDLRPAFLREIALLMPFGYTNPSPTFVTEGVYPSGQIRVVGGKHLRLKLSHKRFVNSAIGFNMGDLAASLSPSMPINIAYSLDLDPSAPGSVQQLRLTDIQFPYSTGLSHGGA